MGDELQSFLALAKGARGRGAAAVIGDATAAPGLFAFGELLDTPSVKELEGTEFAPALELLRLFAFGTLADYTAAAATLPPLSPQQLLKLKQLTVATLAEDTKVLPYDTLAAALGEPLPPGASVRALEDFLINECFGTGLIKGKLDQRRRCLEVHWAAARDMKPGQLARMQATLAQWVAVADNTVASLQQRCAWGASATAAAAAHAAELEAKQEAVRKSVKAELEVRGAPLEGHLSGYDASLGAALGGGGDLYGDEDRGPGGRPKRRR